MDKRTLLNALLMTGMIVTSSNVLADTMDQYPQDQTTPTAEHTSTTTDLQNSTNQLNNTIIKIQKHTI